MARLKGIRSFAALAAVLVSLALPAATGATPPKRGVHYAGMLAVQHVSGGRTLEYPIHFYVEGSGEDVEHFDFPNGVPFSLNCAEGPLGEPFNGAEAPISARGTIDTYIRLVVPGEEEANPEGYGTVHVAGAFRRNGLFVGSFDNRTSAKVCRVSYEFKMHALSQ